MLTTGSEACSDEASLLMLRDITPCRDIATTCYDTGLFHPDPPLLPLRTSDLDTEFFHTDMKVLAVHCHGQPTVLYCVPTNPGPRSFRARPVRWYRWRRS